MILGLFVAADLGMLIVFNTGLEVLSATRAYVGGEGLYSKAQKDAVGHLRDFAESHSDSDYQLYQAAIAVPLGDREARIEMEKAEPELAAVYAGLAQGANHSSDLSRMVWLFRTFRHVSYIARAVDIWTAGDADVQLLQEAAERLRNEIGTATPRPETVSRSLTEIAEINSNLAGLEDSFSSTLGDAARWVQSVLLVAEGLASAMLLGGGGFGIWRVTRHLSRSEADYRGLVDTAVDAVIAVDANGRIVLFNPAAEVMFDQPAQTVLGWPLGEVLVLAGGAEFASASPKEPPQVVGKRRDGTVFEAECGVSRSNYAGTPGQTLIVRDITQRRRTEQVLAASEARAQRESERLLALHHASTLLATQTAVPGAVLEEVLRSAVTLLQGTAASLYHWDPADAVLRCVSNWNVPLEDVTPDVHPDEGLAGHTFSQGAPLIVNDYLAWDRGMVTGRAGGLRAGLGVPLIHQGTCVGVLLIRVYGAGLKRFDKDDARLATLFGDQVAAALFLAGVVDEQRYAALHDALTGLPNRKLLGERLDQAIVNSQQERCPMALLLIDLDRFKEINDTFGHHYGDVLLQQIGPRLRGVLRTSDTIARLGGDEFAVLLPATDSSNAVPIAELLLRVLAAPYLLDGQTVEISGSIGVAGYPAHGRDAETLLRQADVAMYAAKRTQSGLVVYAAEHDHHTADRLALGGELRLAIETDELVLQYQPKVDLSGRLAGVEALVRWRHPQRGMIAPDEFIGLAEHIGLIKPLTRWVLDAALRQCRAWLNTGLEIPVAVNVSMHDLHDDTLPDTVTRLLVAHGIPAAYLAIEITEGAIMSDASRAMSVLTRLRAVGVSLSVDDFGTGYSSLAYLKRLPVDELKIDRSFVRNIATDEEDAAIVRSTIGLGHDLGLTVVAEGVEDQACWDHLQQLGCDLAQGYFVARPLSASGLDRWLTDSVSFPALWQASA
ncbi:MAG: EAL domain-containing protein [Chloroflexota bacterium]|nr:EAL domain-containing protein [Chloroflexota bacterium]